MLKTIWKNREYLCLEYVCSTANSHLLRKTLNWAKICPGQRGSVGWSVATYTKGLGVQFSVRAHRLWVQFLGWGLNERQPIDVSLSHSLSLSLSPLSFSLKSINIFFENLSDTYWI